MQRDAGHSLPELLVALVLFAVFAAGVHQLCVAVLRNTTLLEAVSEAQESVQIGVELISRELRGAGYSPDASLRDGLRQATAEAITIASDFNGDGDTEDANERIAYRIDHTRGTLTRATGSASPQPMLDHLPADGLTFTYYAADGHALGSGAALSAEDRSRVRRVDVALAVELSHPHPAVTGRVRAAQTASVHLRNGN